MILDKSPPQRRNTEKYIFEEGLCESNSKRVMEAGKYKTLTVIVASSPVELRTSYVHKAEEEEKIRYLLNFSQNRANNRNNRLSPFLPYLPKLPCLF